MLRHVATTLRELDRRKAEYGDGAAERKQELLLLLEKRYMPRARDTHRLHEVLCFLRAYPDNAELLGQVERVLATFSERGDLRRHRRALANSGIAGTPIHFSFYAPTAGWLARKWGAHLTIDWGSFDQRDKLEPLLSLLALYGETPGLDEFGFGTREWIGRLNHLPYPRRREHDPLM